jgi:hypothetical protein
MTNVLTLSKVLAVSLIYLFLISVYYFLSQELLLNFVRNLYGIFGGDVCLLSFDLLTCYIKIIGFLVLHSRVHPT